MRENQILWVAAIFALAQAVMLPTDAANGLWVATGDSNWNFKTPIHRDHASEPDPKMIENYRRQRTETSKGAAWTWRQAAVTLHNGVQQLSSESKAASPWRRTISASGGGDAQQFISGFKPAWPWRPMKTQIEEFGSETKNVGSVCDDPSTMASSAPDGAGCGQNPINGNELQHALQQMVDYCDQTGFVEAYQNLASKWGSTIVYICARGHIESCHSNEFVSAITYIHYACAPESGWVYINVLYPDRPATKYGMDVTGADFC
ncbi:hypothetical protein TruAng_005019 [Truncatella angustata]|nr:hypothetical protein TruAng_005019 [Truncatella angustata]